MKIVEDLYNDGFIFYLCMEIDKFLNDFDYDGMLCEMY